MPQRTLSEQEFEAIKNRLLDEAPDGLDEAGFQRWFAPRFEGAIAEAEHLPPSPQGSAVGRFAKSALGFLDPRPALSMAADVLYPSGAGLVRQMQLGEAIADTSKEQAGKAVASATRGTGWVQRAGGLAEAVGHTVAAVPVVGMPFAQVDRQIEQGDLAGAAGTATGIVGSAMVPALARDLRSRLSSRAPALRQKATTGYEKALGATTKENKVRAARVAPEMAKRGVVAKDLPALEARAGEESAKAGQAVGALVERVKDQPVDVMGLVERLEPAKAQFIGTALDGRRVINDPAPVQAISNLQSTLMEYGDKISVGSMNKLRMNWDAIVDRAKGFTTEDVAVKGWAAREGRSALREALTQVAPDADQVMAEYSFWQSIEDITHATNLRRVGQKGTLTPTIAAAGGAVVGEMLAPGSGALTKLGSAAVGAKFGASLRRLLDSPGYQMLSASYKQQLADALASGKRGLIQSRITQGLEAIGAEAAVATTTADTQTRNRPRAGSLLQPAAP